MNSSRYTLLICSWFLCALLTQTLAQGDICVQPIDLVFALDASSSVGVEDYSKVKQFTSEIINGFEIGVDKTHVGVLTFSEYAEVQIGLTDTFDKQVLSHKVENLPYAGFRTATDDALRAANKNMFSLAGGVRSGVSQVLVLVTDGKCTVCTEPLLDAVKPLKEKGVSIYVIGIGNNLDQQELETIASDRKENHIFLVQTPDDLKGLTLSIQKKTCKVKRGKCAKPVGPFNCDSTKEDECFGDHQCLGVQKCCFDGCVKQCKYPLYNGLMSVDIAFALDSSSSVRGEAYKQMKEFASQIVDSFSVSQQEARFAALTYSNEAEVGFNFIRYDTAEQVKKAIGELRHLKDTTRVDKALELAKSDLFSLQGKVRTRRPMVLVVFFDGDVERGMKDLAEVAEPLKSYGVRIVAIGVGPEVNEYQVKKIASSDSAIFKGETFSDVFPELYSVAKEVSYEKAGKCHAELEPIAPGVCDGAVDECKNDYDCYGISKCCKKGCIKTCVMPDFVSKRKIDIAFAVHQNLKADEFDRVKDFLKSSVDHFEVASDKTHFAVLTFGQKPRVAFNFKQGQDLNRKVKERIGAINHEPGKGKIADVLGLSCDAIFCAAGGTRDSIPKMLVIVTGPSSPSAPEEMKRHLAILRNRGVDVIVIGIGDVNAPQLQTLTSDDSTVDDRVWLTKYASGALQYSQDLADFASGEAGLIDNPVGGPSVGKVTEGGCKPKTCYKGQKGARGRPGPIGGAGDPGITGLSGSKGLRGRKGTKGPNGMMGPKGVRGQEGLIGLPGFPGYNGIPGVPGVEGRRGPDGGCGFPGKSGSAGLPGLDGFNGPPGRRGPAGPKGGKGLPAPIDPNLKIEPGDEGEPGEAGNVGFKGEKAAYGDKGPRGDDGPDGKSGIVGEPGDMGDYGTVLRVKGPKGNPGPRGNSGPKYSTGDPGEGIQGPQGKNGSRGEKGEPGAKGVDSNEPGLKGQKGLQGPLGENGEQGPAGPDGNTGVIGEKGLDGEKGERGDSGRVGLRGSQGGKGGPGDKGRAGNKGEIGEDGAPLPGPNGAAGENGVQGKPGRQGDIGKSGPLGPKGKQGGIQMGPGGDPGPVGARGLRGKNGMAGEPGMEGVIGSKGVAGDAGERGGAGRNGEIIPGKNGMDGPPGSGGDPGPVGDTGFPGPPGEDVNVTCIENVCPKGQKGVRGPPGNTGKTGPDGPFGPSGSKGYPGGPCPLCPPGSQGASGDVGEPGRPGKNGEAGSEGDQGDAGPQGEQGPTGELGGKGTEGVKGVRGETGRVGQTGDDSPGINPGPKGSQGQPGEDGTPGSRGQKGVKGQNGTKGSSGPDGRRGRRGPKGDIGLTGPKGRDGESGVPGTKGVPGEGERGPIGEAGNLGRQGPQGEVGEPGQDGGIGAPGTPPTEEEMKEMKNKMMGDKGRKGPLGAQGETGPVGPLGPDGPRGKKGVRGARGSRGFGGVKGDTGDKGRAGTDGDPGSAGFPGLFGKTGESGEPGQPGPPGVTPKGEKGEPGPRGPDGNPGEDAPPPAGCIQFGDPTDIVFLLDSSRSVNIEDFERQKNFTKDILKQFPIGPSENLAGIIKYGTTADIELDFTTKSSVDLFNKIDAMRHAEADESRLDLALKVAKDELFTEARGARKFVNERQINQALIILGDGFVSGKNIKSRELQLNVIKYAKELKDTGVNVFAIGVGPEKNKYLLQEIVTKKTYYLEIESYSQLVSAIGQLKQSFNDVCVTDGDPGQDGIPGLPGDDGIDGKKGEAGDAPKGLPGQPGLQGLLGDPGAGIAGMPGEIGLMGLPGDLGRRGAPGRNVTGPTGRNGEKGDKGTAVAGPKGVKGESGLKGEQGPDAARILCDYVLATDILFLLDASSSVGAANFDKIKQFIRDITKSFDVDNQLTRVGVIVFNEDAQLSIKLNEYNSQRALDSAISQLQYVGGSATRMDKALQVAYKQAFTEQNGARAGVRRALVLLTDGQQSFAPDSVDLATAVKPLVDDEVLRYVIGVGREIAPTELKTIAGDNVVLASDFDQLKLKINDQIGLIGRGGCKGDQGLPGRKGQPGDVGFPGFNGDQGPKGPSGDSGVNGTKGKKGEQGENSGAGRKGSGGDIGDAGPIGLPGCLKGGENVATDLGFMVDASGSLYQEGFTKEKEFVKNVINRVGPMSAGGLRAAVVVYSDEANIRIKFDDHTSNRGFNDAVDKLPYDKQGTRLDLGLKKSKEMFTRENGGRGNSKKVLILLTDGQQTYVPGVTEPSDIAKELAADGIDVFSIGIGQEINRLELESFISKPEHIFLASDINSLVADLGDEISQALECQGGPRGPEGQSGDDGPPGSVGQVGQIGDLGPKGYAGEAGSGPKGDQGKSGPIGSRGDEGDKGFRGPTGPIGNRGPRGPPGFIGEPGPKGDSGLPGFIGNEGPEGPAGPKGVKGATVGEGRPGAKGEPGEKGPKGPRGDRGSLPPGSEMKDIKGNKGPGGVSGLKGARGDPGDFLVAPGPIGTGGDKGDPGEQGEQGDRGAIGPKGLMGIKGTPGETGRKGEYGDDGKDGRKGVQGPNGDQGTTGAGRKGERGERGPNGKDGAIGDAGEDGLSGFIGMEGKKGDRGEAGAPGEQQLPEKPDASQKGFFGEQGDRGDIGYKGVKGEPGILVGAQGSNGADGEPGRRGPGGPKGLPGGKGVKGSTSLVQGFRGRLGSDGDPGSAGPPGRKGEKGETIGGSEKGDKGVGGPIGPKGRPGLKGRPGVQGDSGNRGPDGSKGPRGDSGFPGLIGNQGPDGGKGKPGVLGDKGAKGQAGSAGPVGPNGIAEGFYIVRHSQDSFVPSCPRDYKMLWEGYSLMYTVGNGHAHAQDLADAGSCSRSFSTIPFLFCARTGSCKYASRNDFVYWLSGDVTQPMMPVSNTAIEPFISRCVVCQAPAPHIAVHSQDVSQPACPTGWDSLWNGYSFMMVGGAGKTGAGQSLSSSGSCLESFRPKPFIECQGARGTCHFFSDKYSFWLTTIDVNNQFKTQEPQTLSRTKGDILETRVSRCKVCIRKSKGQGGGNEIETGFFRRFARSVKNLFKKE